MPILRTAPRGVPYPRKCPPRLPHIPGDRRSAACTPSLAQSYRGLDGQERPCFAGHTRGPSGTWVGREWFSVIALQETTYFIQGVPGSRIPFPGDADARLVRRLPTPMMPLRRADRRVDGSGGGGICHALRSRPANASRRPAERGPASTPPPKTGRGVDGRRDSERGGLAEQWLPS